MKKEMHVVLDKDGSIIGVINDKYTLEVYKSKGYHVAKTRLLEETNKDVSNVKFKIMSINHDEYENSGNMTEHDGTILLLLDDLFDMIGTISDKKISNKYVSFKEFLEHADKANTENLYPGTVNAENLADIFIDSCDSAKYLYKYIESDCKVDNKDIVDYIESLYIDEEMYVKNRDYELFFGLGW